MPLPRNKGVERRQRRAALALASPAYLAIALTTLLPLAGAFWLSLTSYDLLSDPRWVGGENYVSLLGDAVFWESTANTFSFAVTQVVIGIVLALGVALLFNARLRGGATMRTIVYLPQAASYVVIALVWSLLMDPAVGPINQAIEAIGGDPIYFFTDRAYAMPSIIVISLWRNLGYYMIILLAALKSVPRELLEAASLDGANAPRRFVAVTLPVISGAMFFVVVTWFLGGLQMFTQSYVLTDGGPVHATRTLVFLMYDEAFTNLNIGRASAIAVLLFMAVVIVAVPLRLTATLLSRRGEST